MTDLDKLYIVKNNKRLKYGYSTGSCAAAAAKAATIMLFSKKEIVNIELMTPKGINLNLLVEDIDYTDDYVSCAIKKYSGDDPDVTNGILLYAKVKLNDKQEISIDGGVGVGRVTRSGLEQEIGSAAINKVPRLMIKEAVKEVCEQYDYHGGIDVIISIPEGKEIAKRTFNPRLGIEGGLSILGTSGIVEPMSEKAIVDSILIELKMLKANGIDNIVITPGNYGTSFSKEILSIPSEYTVKCSNYIGEVIDMIVELGFKSIVFIGHIGKFVKLAAGIMNTHSRNADARMEIMATHAFLAGANNETIRKILDSINTEETIDLLNKYELTDSVIDSLLEKIEFYIDNRAYHKLDFGIILFSNKHGILGKTNRSITILKQIKENNI